MRCVAALFLLVLFGCSTTSDYAIKAVDEYCDTVSAAKRAEIRAEVNSALAPDGHSIKITCAGD